MVVGGTVPNRVRSVALAALILTLPGLVATAAAQAVEWTNLVNVSVSGTTLQKTSGCDGCDDGGAQSQQQIDSPGGYVEFTVGEANTFWIGGLSNGNSSPSYTGIDFAFRFNGAGGADVLQNGVYKGGDTSYAAGDVFRIAVAYGRVQFSRNGAVLYTSRTAPTYPLVLDVAFGTMGASLFDAQLSHELVGDPPPPPPPLTGSNITWTDLVNVTPGDSVLQKTSGCGGCDDAGARSQEAIVSGDGFVEFTVGEMNTFWVAGLSHDNSDTTFGDIDFAFRFNGAGLADVLENGVYKGGDSPYAVGDVFRVAVVSGHVRYWHNGELMYVSQIAPTYPLLLDTALGTADATIYNAKLYLSGINGLANLPAPDDTGALEIAGQQPFRARLTPQEIEQFLPTSKGAFTFPQDPYSNALGVRLTDPGDCGGQDCVWYVGDGYWRRINNHEDSEEMLIVLGLAVERGGTGPTLFTYNKTTKVVQNRGGLFDPNNDQETGSYRLYTAEDWYFSARKENATKLYVYYPDSPQLRRYDVLAHTFEPLPAMDSDQCPRPSVCPAEASRIHQPHSSDDDHVHSATLQDANYTPLGCIVYRDNALPAFRFYPKRPGDDYIWDECSVDKSGRWLFIEDHRTNTDDDNRVIDLQSDDQWGTLIPDAAGAHGHFDLGYGYSVGADNQDGTHPNVTTLITFPVANPAHPRGPAVHFNPDWFSVAANHVSHTNAKPGPPHQQYACGSDAERNSLGYTRRDEIVCFMLDPLRYEDKSLDVLVVAPVMTDLDSPAGIRPDDTDPDYSRRPKGNLDITGEYFIWTSNMGGISRADASNRIDAFIVKVPARKLLDGRPQP